MRQGAAWWAGRKKKERPASEGGPYGMGPTAGRKKKWGTGWRMAPASESGRYIGGRRA
jgi:hypothetical protein